MTIAPLRAIGYVRVLNRQQLEQEAEIIFNYAVKKNYDLINIISDIYTPNTNGPEKKQGFERILEMAMARQFNVLLVFKLNRLTNSIKQAVHTINSLQEAGIIVQSVSDGIDTSITGEVFKILASIENSTKNAKPPGVEPLGYRKINGKLTVSEKEIMTIKRIFELKKQGLTLRVIAKTLTEEGCATKRGGKWYASTVKAILNNSKYQAILKS